MTTGYESQYAYEEKPEEEPQDDWAEPPGDPSEWQMKTFISDVTGPASFAAFGEAFTSILEPELYAKGATGVCAWKSDDNSRLFLTGSAPFDPVPPVSNWASNQG